MSAAAPVALPLFAALLSLPLLCACSEVTVVAAGGGGQGSGGAPAAGGEGQGNQGGESPPPVPCEQRSEATCEGDCVAMVDWTPLVPGAPPPPPGIVLDSEPCCPECAEPQCVGCHQPAFKRCVPLDQCGVPQPPEDCGVPLSCGP